MESDAVAGTSPKGTAWAEGTPPQLCHADLQCVSAWRADHRRVINKTFVVHLTSASDNIYLQLTLTNWGGECGSGDKTFGYTRSTAPAPTPAISITNPASGAVFVAPANVGIGATASVSSGTVTNVQFFTNGSSLKSVTTTPFMIAASNLAAGAYALKAVATAAGISATSAVVNIAVVSTPAVSITNPVSGAAITAPANVHLGASATVAGGTVTNVQFLTNGVPVAAVTTAPFTLTAQSGGGCLHPHRRRHRHGHCGKTSGPVICRLSLLRQ